MDSCTYNMLKKSKAMTLDRTHSLQNILPKSLSQGTARISNIKTTDQESAASH